jgi:hypothetical protein
VADESAKTHADEERDAWFGFLTVHSLVTRELDALLGAAHGMPLVEYEVLLKLSIAGGRLRMSELAYVALLSRSGLTRIVDELEARSSSAEIRTRAMAACSWPPSRRWGEGASPRPAEPISPTSGVCLWIR